MTLQEVKEYLRVDSDADDNLISTLMGAAEDYLKTAVDGYEAKVAKGDTNWNYKANTAKMLLISDWYENRTAVGRPVAAAVTMLITQLQYDTLEGDEDES